MVHLHIRTYLPRVLDFGMGAAPQIPVELPHEHMATQPVSAWNRPLDININKISLLNFKKKDLSEGKE